MKATPIAMAFTAAAVAVSTAAAEPVRLDDNSLTVITAAGVEPQVIEIDQATATLRARLSEGRDALVDRLSGLDGLNARALDNLGKSFGEEVASATAGLGDVIGAIVGAATAGGTTSTVTTTGPGTVVTMESYSKQAGGSILSVNRASVSSSGGNAMIRQQNSITIP